MILPVCLTRLVRRHAIACLTTCALVAGAAVLGFAHAQTNTSATGSDTQPPALPSTAAAVPVTTARAARRDVPIYARGLGTVQAFRSVMVRARVDGTLDRIAFTEGQEVKPGDLLAEIDPRPYAAALAQAQAHKQADQAQLANAQLDLARYSNLAHSQFASRQQVDTQSATVRQVAANIAADDAAIATAALNLSFCRITSPIQGVVGLKQVDIGNLIHATDTTGIVTITQVHPISVIFTLPQGQLPSVQDALSAGRPAVVAYSSGSDRVLDTGVLLTPDNTIDAATGTIRLKAVFENPHNRLWPGQFVEARLQLGTDHDVIAVPPAAVQHGPAGLFVYALRQGSSVVRLPVTEGYTDPDVVVISQGLNGGEQVVVGGQSRLQDGTRVVARYLTSPQSQTPAPVKGVSAPAQGG